MARALLLLALAFLLLGCVTPPPSQPAPSVSASASAIASVAPTVSVSPASATPYASATSYPTADASIYPSDVPTATPVDYLPRIASTTARPSNPDRNEPFTLEVSAVDDVGLQSISWQSYDALSSVPASPSFDCGMAKSCSATFTFKSASDGERIIRVYATDSSGQEAPRSPITITVRPFDYKEPTATPLASVQSSPVCGNGVCDASESSATCSADCPAATASAQASVAACTSDESCGYKQVCQGGECVDVDCTNDAQCGYGKECESNRCVRCPSGPYGPAC